MAPSRAMVILLVLVPLAAMVSADEGDVTTVEDLGEVGRRAGRNLVRRANHNRRAMAGGISAGGSFQIGFQGNHEEDTDEVNSQAEELGEPDKTSMKELGSDAALKEEVTSREGTEPFDWTQCMSEGETQNCALCKSSGGALPCEGGTPKEGKATPKEGNECRDDKILKGRYWLYKGFGVCSHIYHTPFRRLGPHSAVLKGMASTFRGQFPRLGYSSKVITKVYADHPAKANKSVGILMFKRIVTHKCIGGQNSTCHKDALVADMYKAGYCVKCKDDVFPHIFARFTTETHRRAFLERCLPDAVDNDGNLKEDFKCSPEDQERAADAIMAF